GYAHSFETWRGSELVGGLYGVAIGRMFYGESMFSRATDASKVALVTLVRELKARNFPLIDCQMSTPLLASLGAREIPRLPRLRAGTHPGPRVHRAPLAAPRLEAAPRADCASAAAQVPPRALRAVPALPVEAPFRRRHGQLQPRPVFAFPAAEQGRYAADR